MCTSLAERISDHDGIDSRTECPVQIPDNKCIALPYSTEHFLKYGAIFRGSRNALLDMQLIAMNL